MLITFTAQAGNAVLSGLFFNALDDHTDIHRRRRVRRLGRDDRGTWIGTHGTRATTSSAAPPASPATPWSTPRGSRPTPGQARPTPRPAGPRRRPAASPPAWYSRTSFTVDVNLTDGQAHDLELYAQLGLRGRANRCRSPTRRRRRAVHPDGLVVQDGDLPRLRGQRERPDHLHEAGRAERRAQRPLPRPDLDPFRPTPPTITWANPAGIVYGTPCRPPSSTPPPACRDLHLLPGRRHGPEGGQDTLSVTFTPTDTADYKTATASATIAVAQAAPAITWANPAGIAYGTALSARPARRHRQCRRASPTPRPPARSRRRVR